jgi:hypothetical protein
MPTCDFARQLGVNAKQSYRPSSLKEQQVLEHELEFSSVKDRRLEIAVISRAALCHDASNGISAKDHKESLSMYALARLLKKRRRSSADGLKVESSKQKMKEPKNCLNLSRGSAEVRQRTSRINYCQSSRS